MAKRSLKFKFIFVTCVICLLCLLLVSVVSYRISYNIVKNEAKQKSVESVQKYASEMNNWFVEQSTLVLGMVEDIEINGDYSEQYLLTYLTQKLERHNAYVIDYYMGFVDKNKKFLDGSGWVPPADFDCHSRKWYIAAIKDGGVIFTTPYLDASTGKMIVTIAAPVKQNGKIIGVLGADIPVTDLVTISNKAKKASVDYAFLLDQENNFLVHPDKSLQPTPTELKNAALVMSGKYKPLLKNLNNGGYTITEFNDYDGIDKYFILSNVKSSNWVLGIAIAKAEYLKPLNKLLVGFVIALVISLALGVVIILIMVNGLLKPINQLRQAVNRYSQKDFDARSPVIADDEVGELSDSFNYMADIIQAYNHNLEEKVAERTRELQEKNNDILESINYAKRIQLSILPDMSKYLGISDAEHFVIWKPRDIVGGDFYWCKKVNNSYFLALADCTGHGVPGALMTMTVNAILDRVIDQIDHENPARVLQEVNRILKETLRQDDPHSLTNDGVDIGLCLIKPEEKLLIYAGAKISLLYCQEDELIEIKGDKQSLGYKKSKLDFAYCNHEINLNPANVYYLFSDGFVDQNGRSNEFGFGRKRLKQAIVDNHSCDLYTQKEIFTNMLNSYMGDEAQRDDITLIGFKIADCRN